MSYRIEVLIVAAVRESGTVKEWRSTHPSHDPKPYVYETRDEAESVARMCYPDQTRFGWETVRVAEVTA